MKTLQCVFYDNSSHVFFRPNTVHLWLYIWMIIADVKLLKTWINRTVGEREMGNVGLLWQQSERPERIVSEFKRGDSLPRSSLKSTASSNVQSRTVVADSFKPHTSPGSLPRYNLTLLQGEKTHYYANQVSHQPPRLSVWGTTLPKREYCFFLLSSPF